MAFQCSSDDFDGRFYECWTWNIVFEQERKRRELLACGDGDGQVVSVHISQQVAASVLRHRTIKAAPSLRGSMPASFA